MVVSDRAQRRVNEFQQRCGEYGEAALHLAYHAALPVALNAELLHLFRINFFLDPPEVLPYTVEFEFLLSPLCREIDEGLYEIEPEIRDVLLAGLTQTYGTERTRDIATLLWQYVERQDTWSDRVELERAQQLTALSFLNPEKAQQWLETVETEVSQGQVTAREWFIAMRQEIENQGQLRQEREDEALEFLPALSFLSREQQLQFKQQATIKQFRLGQVIWATDIPGTHSLIVNGQVRLISGQRPSVLLKPGDWIGDLLGLSGSWQARAADREVTVAQWDANLWREVGSPELDRFWTSHRIRVQPKLELPIEQTVQQLGKYQINVGEAQNFQIGDRHLVASLRSLSTFKEWTIHGDVMRIGRSSDNDLVLPEDSPGVSREHATISYRPFTEDNNQPTYVLEDFSRYGTWILNPEAQDWQKVHREEVVLSSGTQVKFGSSNNAALEFIITQSNDGTSPSPTNDDLGFFSTEEESSFNSEDSTNQIPIEELQLSEQTYNSLKQAYIDSIEDLLDYSQEDLLQIMNLDNAEEVIQALQARLGITLPGGIREDIVQPISESLPPKNSDASNDAASLSNAQTSKALEQGQSANEHLLAKLRQKQKELGLTESDNALQEVDPQLAQNLTRQENLEFYEQMFLEMVQRQLPIQDGDRRELQYFQKVFRLSDEESFAIEQRVLNELGIQLDSSAKVDSDAQTDTSTVESSIGDIDQEPASNLQEVSQQEFEAYLVARGVNSQAIEWLRLYLRGLSQDAIAGALNATIKQVYRLREQITYHATRAYVSNQLSHNTNQWLQDVMGIEAAAEE